MSNLTHALTSPAKESVALRTFLKQAFPTPKVTVPDVIVSPSIGKSPSLVGKAFDYLLRFELERAYPSHAHSRRWVAEAALTYFREGDTTVWDYDQPDDMPDQEWLASMQKQVEHNKVFHKQVQEKFIKCQQTHTRYVNGQKVPIHTLLDTCFFLSLLDDVVRIGPRAKMFVETSPVDKKNFEDLRCLRNNLDLRLLTPKSHCILNPTFGKSSSLVAADGDLLIDHTLIDIKTTKKGKLDRAAFNQVICYYLLYTIGGISRHKGIEVNSIGIYFSRYNHLWTMPVSDLGNKKSIADAVRLLKRACK
jgi:hypothetical protein